MFSVHSGIAMLTFALLMSARMGIFQETLYKQYGKHSKEALFYNVSFLSAPMYTTLPKDSNSFKEIQASFALNKLDSVCPSCLFVALPASAGLPAFFHRHLQPLCPLQSKQ